MGVPGDRRAVLQRALAEIDDEAARQRSAGAVPAQLEADLDRRFAALSPRGGGWGHLLRQSVGVVSERAALDTQVPVASNVPGGATLKRVVRKLVGWYVRFFVAQLARFTTAVARALDLAARDLADVRRALSEVHPPLPDDVVRPTHGGPAWWAQRVLGALARAPGPVLHAECGDGVLLGALRDAGIEAYGADPSPEAVAAAAASGLDARLTDAHAELQVTADAGLGGLVLSGSVQWMAPEARTALLADAESAIAPGGVLVVASATPEAWARTAPPVVLDLAPGRPLHSETWAYLLERAGFDVVDVQRGGPELGDAGVPGHSEYVVVAVRRP
jgi:SAM-dependent methyltransferase